MRNILMLAEPVEGHFNPFMPIISKFVERRHNARCLTGRGFKERVESLGAAILPLPAQWDAGSQESGLRFFPTLRSLTGLAQIKFYSKHFMYAQVSDILNALESVLKDFKANAIIEVIFRVAGTWLRELGGPPSVRLSVIPLSLLEKDIAPFEMGLSSGTSYFSKLRNNLLNVLLLFKDVQPHIIELRKTVRLPPYEKYLFISAVKSPGLVLHTSTPSFEYFRTEFPANFQFIGSVVLPPKDGYQQPDWRQDIEQYKDKSNTPSI